MHGGYSLRYGIFGDIHGNHDALDAVLEVLEKEKVDTYLCTGDVVGYGAEPSKCIKTVREKCVICLAGNHDHAACGKLDTEFFNVFAKQVAHWTQTHLSEDEKQWLAGLPFVCHFEDFTLAHGSAHSPEVFNYITNVTYITYVTYINYITYITYVTFIIYIVCHFHQWF